MPLKWRLQHFFFDLAAIFAPWKSFTIGLPRCLPFILFYAEDVVIDINGMRNATIQRNLVKLLLMQWCQMMKLRKLVNYLILVDCSFVLFYSLSLSLALHVFIFAAIKIHVWIEKAWLFWMNTFWLEKMLFNRFFDSSNYLETRDYLI